MRITDEQERIIESLHCERLSSCTDNFRLVDDFYNGKNPSIVDTLQNEAFDDDVNHRIAYYVVKGTNNEILFYFSLKGADKDAINAILEKARTKKGLKKVEVARALHLSLDSDELAKIFVEKGKIVGTTFAGVEIVHFCINEAYRERWESLGIQQTLGTVVFWKFVVSKVLELMEIAGCEYLFLFAADLSEDADLVNYYIDKLGFVDAGEHCAAQPMYDFACRFLCQETSTLTERREEFFAHFNSDEEV